MIIMTQGNCPSTRSVLWEMCKKDGEMCRVGATYSAGSLPQSDKTNNEAALILHIQVFPVTFHFLREVTAPSSTYSKNECTPSSSFTPSSFFFFSFQRNSQSPPAFGHSLLGFGVKLV